MARSKKEVSEQDQSKNPLQRAWCSGVFDARINFSTRVLTLKLESSDETLIKRFHQVIGVGSVVKSDRKKNQGPIILWLWQTTSLHESWLAIRYVLPLLSTRKKKQALEALSRIEVTPVWLRKYGHLAFTRKPIQLPDSKDKPADPDLI